jgi:hypothetical protein
METFGNYIAFIEEVEANRFELTPHYDSDGTAYAQEVEPGCLFDSYTEEAA